MRPTRVHLHPRVALQGLAVDEAARERLIEGLPRLVPFREDYRDVLSVLDWDHRLPSMRLVLRCFATYDAGSAARTAAAFEERTRAIAARDRFPEFDVPDFDDLPADEAYETELGPDLAIGATRLVSPWRRRVDPVAARDAVKIAARAEAVLAIQKMAEDAGRPAALGGLEAAGWSPPCESAHARWTVDVWYLLSFDGRVGKGRSFLVDVEAGEVIAVREIELRA